MIGVDQSADRLNRRKPYPEALLPKNMVFVRADLVDLWRLLDEAGLRLARHYVLYPNPWPKIGHLGRRWHAHPVFPWIPRLGGVLECRSNWLVYIEEFALALEVVIGRPVAWEAFSAEVPLTPFERKYRDSGQTLYRLGVDLPWYLFALVFWHGLPCRLPCAAVPGALDGAGVHRRGIQPPPCPARSVFQPPKK